MGDHVYSELPHGWALAAIEDILAPLADGQGLHQGWSPQCENGPSESPDEWGVLKTTAIQPGTFLPEHNKRLPSNLAPRPLIEVNPGDLLLTCAGPRSRCGIACLVRNTPGKLMMSGKMYRFRVPEESIDPRFVEAFLQTPIAHYSIDGMKTGGSDSGLNLTQGRFRRLEVPIAPFNEQLRIVEIYEELLSDLNAGVAALERARDRLKLYRASMLKAAVEGALTADWREGHPDVEPADELLKRILVERRRRWEQDQLRKFEEKGKTPPKNWKAKYKEPVAPDTTSLPTLPEGWCWTTLEQCSLRIRYGSSAKTSNDSTGIPVLRMGNLTSDGRLLVDKLKHLPFDHYEFPDLLLAKGDVLFNRTNSAELVGKAAVYGGVPNPCSFASYLIQVRLLPGVVPHIFTYALNGSLGRAWIKTVLSQTVGQANVNGTKLAAFAFPLPSAAEQETIVASVQAQLSAIDQLEADIDAKLQSAQALRQSILKHAFTGKLVSQDPDDEPASELLKRIAAERKARVQEATAAKRKRAASRRGRK